MPDDLTGVVGVTAGASAPEWLIEELLDRLAPTHGVEVVHTTDEDEYFPPPPELRDLLALPRAGGEPRARRPVRDRGANGQRTAR